MSGFIEAPSQPGIQVIVTTIGDEIRNKWLDAYIGDICKFLQITEEWDNYNDDWAWEEAEIIDIISLSVLLSTKLSCSFGLLHPEHQDPGIC